MVVTGANSGIGQATARALAAAGARVVFAVRGIERGNAAAAAMPGRSEVRELDLARLDSVRAFAAGWDRPVDLLINNAGVSPPALARTADGGDVALAGGKGGEPVQPGGENCTGRLSADSRAGVADGAGLVGEEGLKQLAPAGEVAVQGRHADAPTARDLGHRHLGLRVGETRNGRP